MKHPNEFDTLALTMEALNNAEIDLLQAMRENRALATRKARHLAYKRTGRKGW